MRCKSRLIVLIRSMGARIFVYCLLGAFSLGGLVSLAIAAGSTAQRAWLILAGLRAEGIVIAQRQSPNTNDGVHTYAPVVQFTANDGRTYVVTSDVAGPESQFKFGQHLRVLYQPARPDRGRIDTFASLWTLPLVTGVVGSAFSVVPAFVISGWRRRRRAASGRSLPESQDGMPASGPRRVLGIALAGFGIVLAGVSMASSDSQPRSLRAGRIGRQLHDDRVRMGRSLRAGIWIRRGGRRWRWRSWHRRRRPNCAPGVRCFLALLGCCLSVDMEAGSAATDLTALASVVRAINVDSCPAPPEPGE